MSTQPKREGPRLLSNFPPRLDVCPSRARCLSERSPDKAALYTDHPGKTKRPSSSRSELNPRSIARSRDGRRCLRSLCHICARRARREIDEGWTVATLALLSRDDRSARRLVLFCRHGSARANLSSRNFVLVGDQRVMSSVRRLVAGW